MYIVVLGLATLSLSGNVYFFCYHTPQKTISLIEYAERVARVDFIEKRIRLLSASEGALSDVALQSELQKVNIKLEFLSMHPIVDVENSVFAKAYNSQINACFSEAGILNPISAIIEDVGRGQQRTVRRETGQE
jgi:hypothetical protein